MYAMPDRMQPQTLPATDNSAALANAHRLFRQADFRGAAAAFRKIVDAKPSDEAYAGLVRSLLKADDVKGGEESSQKALAAFPESASGPARGAPNYLDYQFR